MKKALIPLFYLLSLNIFAGSHLKNNFVLGTPGIKSINAMVPESILFMGESKHEMVYALDMSANSTISHREVYIKNIDEQIANLLGSNSD